MTLDMITIVALNLLLEHRIFNRGTLEGALSYNPILFVKETTSWWLIRRWMVTIETYVDQQCHSFGHDCVVGCICWHATLTPYHAKHSLHWCHHNWHYTRLLYPQHPLNRCDICGSPRVHYCRWLGLFPTAFSAMARGSREKKSLQLAAEK